MDCQARIAEERRYVASQFFKGIEKDRFLAKVTKSYMAIVGDGRAGIHLGNSLPPPKAWDPAMRKDVELGTFDVVVTNPPFGTKIPIKGKDILSQYKLAHRFVRLGDSDTFEPTNTVLDAQPPQLLFIERCLQLLRPGGRMGIVLPESLFGMPKYRHVSQWLRRRCRVVGIVSMPEDLFEPHTHAKTCVVFLKNEPPSNDDEIFMSVVEWCGHDSPAIPLSADHRTVPKNFSMMFLRSPSNSIHYSVRIGKQGARVRTAWVHVAGKGSHQRHPCSPLLRPPGDRTT